MKICFDTSVLVAAAVAGLKNHEPSLDCFLQYTSEPHQGCCSSHTLAECYATLTALPLKRRIQPSEAHRLIKETFLPRLTILEIRKAEYIHAIERVSHLGLVSGVIYDALHLSCAENQECERFYTYNLGDFRRLNAQGIQITAP